MEGILNLLRKLGYSENEIKTVLNKVPVEEQGLMGTNVATGIFSKPKEGKLAKDFLVSDVIGNPFEIDYYKGRSREDILKSAEAQLNMINDELLKVSYQIVNKNLKLTDDQLRNFSKNLEAKRRFEKDFEAFKTKPEAEVLNIETGKKVEDIETLKEKSGLIAPPTTDLGRIDLRNKQMLQKADEFFKSQEEVEKAEAKRQALIAKQYEGKGYAGGTFGPSGMYRAVARDFLLDQNAKGKIKLTDDVVKNLEERNYISGGQPLMYADPIRVLRYHYGDDVFDKIPLDELNKTSGAKSDILGAMSKIEAKPVKAESPATPGGYMTPGEIKANIEELENIERMIKRREYRFADMTDQQIKNELEHYGSQKNAFEIAFGYDHPEAYEQYIKSKPEKKANGGRIGYAEGTPMAGLVYVGPWEGPWNGSEFLGGPRKGEYYNAPGSSLTALNVPRSDLYKYSTQIQLPKESLTTITIPSSELNPNLSLKDQYLNKLSAIQSSGSSYEDFKNLLESNLQKKANGGSMGLDYLTGMGPSKGYADGGRIGFKIGSGKKLLNVISKFDDLKVKHKEAFKAHDQIFNVDINDKIAPDMIAESMAEIKGKDYFSLSQKEQSDLYKKALAYVDDVRMIKKQNKMSISNEMNQAKQEGIQKTNKMIELGLDPSNSKDYDKFLEMESIKQKYGNMISDDLLQKIMVDDNPQRKAEVLASIDEAMKMQEKGIAPEEIINIMKNTTRTKQADGGSIGLNYLMGF
jgi:hypothetical protein